MVSGKPVDIIKKITDPYLDWWRKTVKIRFGFLDLSVIAAIVFLSFIQNIFFILSIAKRITLGFLFAQVLLSLWNILSFIIGFYIIVIIIRVVGYLIKSSIYSPFWNIIDSISQPLIYRVNSFFGGGKIGNFIKGIIFSLLFLIVILIGGKFLVTLLSVFLYSLPV
jgi:uncharacterized protein YggT (Ycf19 family)